MTTTSESEAEFTETVSNVEAALACFAESSEAEMNSVSQVLRTLAREADTILRRAASIVETVSAEALASMLSTLQSHCLKSKALQETRLGAAHTVFEKLRTEVNLLQGLVAIGRRQEGIASHLKALSMLTNIEAIHISGVESEFRLLAQELSTFSASVLSQTLELSTYTNKRKQNIDETCCAVAVDLPHLKAEVQRMENDLVVALQLIEASLSQLSTMPDQFKRGIRDTAEQITGVISAVQAHDITRQQVEHVKQSLQIVVAKVKLRKSEENSVWPLAYGALTVQAGQLKMIRKIVADWIYQISGCMTGIHRLSAAELVTIGSAILEQWRELSSLLVRFEVLQQKSMGYGSRIQQSLSGVTDLRNMAHRHIEESQTIRHRLRFLTFNSFIEAHQLGARGSGVSAIAKMIKELAIDWNAITDEFQASLEQIICSFDSMREINDILSGGSSVNAHEDQLQTEHALERVSRIATFVAGAAGEMQAVTAQMQVEVERFGVTKSGLASSLAQLDRALTQVEALIGRLEKRYPTIASEYEPAEIEQLLSGFYTTESEGNVMNAVLRGGTDVISTQSLAGNSVELF